MDRIKGLEGDKTHLEEQLKRTHQAVTCLQVRFAWARQCGVTVGDHPQGGGSCECRVALHCSLMVVIVAGVWWYTVCLLIATIPAPGVPYTLLSCCVQVEVWRERITQECTHYCCLCYACLSCQTVFAVVACLLTG